MSVNIGKRRQLGQHRKRATSRPRAAPAVGGSGARAVILFPRAAVQIGHQSGTGASDCMMMPASAGDDDHARVGDGVAGGRGAQCADAVAAAAAVRARRGCCHTARGRHACLYATQRARGPQNRLASAREDLWQPLSWQHTIRA
eukprot:gene12304-biopygen12468